MLRSCNPSEKVTILGTPEQGSALTEDVPWEMCLLQWILEPTGFPREGREKGTKWLSLKGLASLFPRQENLQRDLPPIPSFGSSI